MSGEKAEMTASKHPNGPETGHLGPLWQAPVLYDHVGPNCDSGTRVHLR